MQVSSGEGMRIGALAEAAGVSVSTLRAWEQRYGLLGPERTPGGHRVYGAADLARIREMQRLVADGHTPAAAADLIRRGKSAEAAVTARPRTWWAPAAEGEGRALAAAYAATRSLLRVTMPREVVALLREFVAAVGAEAVLAADAGPEALPLDISLGEGPPVLPVAEPMSLARMQLETLLPPLVDDARLVLNRLRRAARTSRSSRRSGTSG